MSCSRWLRAADQGDDLAVLGEGVILGLAQQAHEALAVGQLALGDLIEVAGELGEDLHLPVLGEIQAQGAGGGLHGLGLGVAAHPGDRQAHVDGGALAGEEELALQEDLPVRDGDDVGGDVGGDVPRLGLHDGEGRHTAAAQGIREVGGALQEAGVQVENVAGIGLPARGALQQKAQGPVGDGVLGEVVIDDEDVLPLVHEVLPQGRGGVGRDILQRRRGAGRGVHHHGIVHGPRGGRGSPPAGRRSWTSGRWPRRRRGRPCPSG